MNKARYNELVRDAQLTLTEQEVKGGWIFCNCEWDGMLIHKNDDEAKCCSCLKERLTHSDQD